MGKDFCLHYMFQTNFSGHNEIWGSQKWGRTAPECLHGYGPLSCYHKTRLRQVNCQRCCLRHLVWMSHKALFGRTWSAQLLIAGRRKLVYVARFLQWISNISRKHS